jgi:hypothetical protein
MSMHYLLLWLNMKDTIQDPATHTPSGLGWVERLAVGGAAPSDIGLPCLAQACASSRRTQTSGTCLSSATAATGCAAHV